METVIDLVTKKSVINMFVTDHSDRICDWICDRISDWN